MKTSSSKAKGRRLQNWVRDQLLALFPNLKGHITCATMGETGADIKLSPTAYKIIPYEIECKNKETGFTAVYDAYKQASQHGTALPLVVIKQNHEKPLVILDATDFFKDLEYMYRLEGSR